MLYSLLRSRPLRTQKAKRTAFRRQALREYENSRLQKLVKSLKILRKTKILEKSTSIINDNELINMYLYQSAQYFFGLRNYA